MGRGWRVTVFSYFEIRFYFLLIVAVSDPSFLLSCTSLIRVPTRFYNFAVIFISWHCIIYLDWLQFIFLSSNLKFKAPLFPFCSVRWSYGSHLPRGRKVWSAPSSSFHTLKWSEVAQSCPTLCDPMDCSLPGPSLHGILHVRVLEWVAISFSRGSSPPRDRTQVSCIPSRRFNLWATLDPLKVGD